MVFVLKRSDFDEEGEVERERDEFVVQLGQMKSMAIKLIIKIPKGAYTSMKLVLNGFFILIRSSDGR